MVELQLVLLFLILDAIGLRLTIDHGLYRRRLFFLLFALFLFFPFSGRRFFFFLPGLCLVLRLALSAWVAPLARLLSFLSRLRCFFAAARSASFCSAAAAAFPCNFHRLRDSVLALEPSSLPAASELE